MYEDRAIQRPGVRFWALLVGSRRRLGSSGHRSAAEASIAAERLVGSRGLPHRIEDLMHDLFTPVKGELQSNPRLADILLIAISGLADLAGVGLVFWSIFSESVRPLVGLLVPYGMRQSVEVLCEWPSPEGMIRRHPGFPSLLVDYGVISDFFFSGDATLIAYATAELAALRRWWLASLGALCTLFIVAVLFSLRAHGTMDVFAGIIAALLAIWIASDIRAFLDCRRAVAGEDAGSPPEPR